MKTSFVDCVRGVGLLDNRVQVVIIKAKFSPPPLPDLRKPMSAETASQTEQASKRATLGLLCGLLAAVGYTLTNMALRSSVRPGDFDWSIWVTAHKAVPATALTWFLVARNYFLGQTCFPPRGLIFPLLGTGLVMQFVGNLSFQYALGIIGLAMTVPITFALILLSGAVFSRLFLGEPITWRSALAMLTLMVSVCLLSFGSAQATRSLLENPSTQQMVLGVCVAMLAGVGYGICGVVIRRNVKNLPVSATLVLISTTGVVTLGTWSFLRLPWETLAATTPAETGMMLMAGVLNAVSFYAIGVSFRHLQVNQVNMVNTTQIAMATIAGILFYAEPLSLWLVSGVGLTVLGLFVMDRHA